MIEPDQIKDDYEFTPPIENSPAASAIPYPDIPPAC